MKEGGVREGGVKAGGMREEGVREGGEAPTGTLVLQATEVHAVNWYLYNLKGTTACVSR